MFHETLFLVAPFLAAPVTEPIGSARFAFFLPLLFTYGTLTLLAYVFATC